MHIRRFLFTLFAVVALSPPFLAAQVKTSGTIPSTGGGASCVSINVDAQATVAIQVTGTWTGTLQPELSVQGQSPANTQVTPSTSTTPASTITANGLYRSSVAGGSTFLVCGNTVASGTANIYLNATTASAGGAGVGGSSGLPVASQAGQYPVSTGAGNAYSAQTKGWFDIKDYGCVADDSTNNATCFTNAAAAVNAWTGSNARPTLFCGQGAGDIAYKSSTGLAFTIPMILTGDCVIDYSGTGNEITLGPTNLVAFTTAQSLTMYEVDGIQHIGGASATWGIYCPPYINCTVRNNHWNNWGNSTNYALKFAAPNPAIEVGSNYWVSGTSGGQNFADIRSCGGVGSDTALFHDNYMQGKNGVFNSSCSGTELYIGGAHSKVVHNSFYGGNANIRVSNEACSYGISIEQNAIDTQGCALSGVNANVILGETGTNGTLDGLVVANNDFDGNSGGYVLAKAADTSSVGLVRSYITGNRSLVKAIPLLDSQITIDSSTQFLNNINAILNATAQSTYITNVSTSALLGSDSCTRANGTLGANWTVVNGAFQILSNTCAANSTAGGGGSLAFYNAFTYPSDQYASVTIAAAGNGVYIGPAVRVAAAADTGYFGIMEGSGSVTITLRKVVAGTPTDLATFAAGPVQVGDVFTISAIGTQLVLARNGTPVLYATDSAISSGSPGIAGFGTTGTTAASSWSAGPAFAQLFNSAGITANSFNTDFNCAAVGTAANPSVSQCSTAPAGLVSCATAASGGTCTVSTTAVTANSEITVLQRTDTASGTRLGVTCNATQDSNSPSPPITAVTAGTSFTFKVGTITTNPECFNYKIVN